MPPRRYPVATEIRRKERVGCDYRVPASHRSTTHAPDLAQTGTYLGPTSQSTTPRRRVTMVSAARQRVPPTRPRPRHRARLHQACMGPEMSRLSPMPQRAPGQRSRRSPRTACRSESAARSCAVMTAPPPRTRAVQHAHPEAVIGHRRFRTVGAGRSLTGIKRLSATRAPRGSARISARHKRRCGRG